MFVKWFLMQLNQLIDYLARKWRDSGSTSSYSHRPDSSLLVSRRAWKRWAYRK